MMLYLPRYEIKLDNFSGSLDLLLHLIKEKKIDLLTIKLIEITDQFLKYIRETKKLNIEIASEYLTIASYLVETKIKLILPKEKIKIDDNYEKNIHEELINRLLEYKKIKKISQYFKHQYQKGIRYLSKPQTIINCSTIKKKYLPLLPKININKLTNSFLKMLERINAKKLFKSNIIITEVSPEEMAKKIMDLLIQNNKKWILEELLSNFILSLQIFIACFIALLNLACHQKIEIKQYQDLETIYIKLYLQKDRS